MNEPLSIPTLTKLVWHDFLHARRILILYEILFKLVEAWLLVPVIAVVFAVVLSRSGHVAVSNLDILDFLLTPTGLLHAALFSTIAAALLLFEQAGVMLLVALKGAAHNPPLRQMLRASFPKSLRIVQLGALLIVLLVLALVPFVLLAWLTYSTFLTGHDIYFYLKERPPAFWNAVGIGVVLLLAALAVGAFLYVRWAFALPVLLFENRYSHTALRASRERTRVAGWRLGFFLIGWPVTVLLVGAAAEVVFRLLAATVLHATGERPIVLVLLLFAQGMLLATLTSVLVIGTGLVTRRLYLVRSGQLGLIRGDEWKAGPPLDKPASPWDWRLARLMLPLFLLAPLALWVTLTRYTKDRPRVLVTAHRGHAVRAPENTLAAMRKAIESGADYAELDVQLTADGVVVLLHDRDLKRVAGVSRRLDEMSFDEVRKLDVGSWFDPSFSSERVPTLAEVIELCRGRIRLNIELKFFGPERQLVQEVTRIVREQDFESDCLLTSLNYEALQEAKRLDPRLRTGLIVAHALGDVSRLEVDALAIRADFITDQLLRSAHSHGKEVHAWTINDAPQVVKLIKRGVNNIITSDPDMAVRVRDEWAEMTGTERLVLSAQVLLGLDPWGADSDPP